MNKGKGFGIGNQTKREQEYIVHYITLEALLNLTTEEAFKWIASIFSKRHTLTSFKLDNWKKPWKPSSDRGLNVWSI